MYKQYHPSNDSPSSTDRLISDTAFIPPSVRVAHPKAVVSGSRTEGRPPGRLPARRTNDGRGTGFCAHWLLVKRLQTLVAARPYEEAAAHLFQSQSLTEVAPCASKWFHSA